MVYNYGTIDQWISLGIYMIGVTLLFASIGIFNCMLINYSEQQRKNKLNKQRKIHNKRNKKSAFIDVA